MVPSLRTALRCLTHPASWGAMIVLLLNDHLLKDLVGGFVTGKVSDFAGLFFFPYLLALAFGIAGLGCRRPNVRLIGAASIAATGIIFTLLKVSPEFNDVVARSASHLLGAPLAFELDPLDLLALLVLVPTWRLWVRQSELAHERLERRAAMPAVIVAACATMATPAIREEPGVLSLKTSGGRMYATVGSPDSYFVTTDNGRTWTPTSTVDALTSLGDTIGIRRLRLELEQRRLYERHGSLLIRRGSLDTTQPLDREQTRERIRVDDSMASTVRLIDSTAVVIRALADSIVRARTIDTVAVASDSRHPDISYRAHIGSTRIERSTDGGRSWSVEWEIMEGRYEYMRRHMRRGNRVLSSGVRDMEFAPDGSGIVIVALDGEGVLVRSVDGEWSEHAVGAFEPVTSGARTAGEVASTILYELFGIAGLGLIAGVVLNAMAWRALGASSDKGASPRRPSTLLRALILGAIILITTGLTAATSPILGPLVAIVLGGPTLLVLGSMIVFDWFVMSGERAMRAPRTARVVGSARSATLLACALPALTKTLWATGAIVDYTVALVLSLAIWIAVLLWGIMRMRE